MTAFGKSQLGDIPVCFFNHATASVVHEKVDDQISAATTTKAERAYIEPSLQKDADISLGFLDKLPL